MDVERTIEFLLEQAARSDVRLARLERAQAATDRRTRALLEVMKLGYRRMVAHEKRTEARFKRVDERFEKMDAKTDARFNQLMKALLGRQNGDRGHGGKRNGGSK